MAGKSNTDGWDKLNKKLSLADNKSVRIGVLGSKGGDEDHEGSEFTIIEIAMVHEFGAPGAGIPERSWIRKTFELKKDLFTKFIEKLVKKLIAEEKFTVDEALNLLGAFGATEIRKTVTDELVTPQLMESEAGRRTAARKGSTKTLIDTGQMINAVSWELDDK